MDRVVAHRIVGGKIISLICCKIVLIFEKTEKDKQKEAQNQYDQIWQNFAQVATL